MKPCLGNFGEHLVKALHLESVVLSPDVGVAQQWLTGVDVDLGVVGPSVSLRTLAVIVVENLYSYKSNVANISQHQFLH